MFKEKNMNDDDTGHFIYEPPFLEPNAPLLKYLESNKMLSEHVVLSNGLTIGEATLAYCRYRLLPKSHNEVVEVIKFAIREYLNMQIETQLLDQLLEKYNRQKISKAIRQICIGQKPATIKLILTFIYKKLDL